MKHLLKLADLDKGDILDILNLADQLKYENQHGIEHHHLKGKTLGMIFQKSSTRTRVSFETGMYQLGGQALFLSNRDLQIGRGEPVQDTARVLSRYLDGIMLSNGPGDPAENTAAIAQLKKLIGKAPIFGICLGHQLLALAMGCKTEKLKYGHRGVNQPVKDLQTGRTYISSQNHGYAVVNDTIEASGGTLRWVNANDGTCEGIDYPAQNAFTVQFHPEACSGPHDTRFLFDRFLQMMGGESHAAE